MDENQVALDQRRAQSPNLCTPQQAQTKATQPKEGVKQAKFPTKFAPKSAE